MPRTFCWRRGNSPATLRLLCAGGGRPSSDNVTSERIRSCLLIAYYYPPGGGVGVQRALKFSKYLPEFGWRPIVLTAEVPLGIPADQSLVVPGDVTLYRTAPT